jgi:hypothetical protein
LFRDSRWGRWRWVGGWAWPADERFRVRSAPDVVAKKNPPRGAAGVALNWRGWARGSTPSSERPGRAGEEGSARKGYFRCPETSLVISNMLT